jgi:outer membrane protein assembly factor BamB
LTIGYNAETGEQRWVKQYEGKTGYSESNAITTDAKGGVFISGISSGICTTIRYAAASGVESWISFFKDEKLLYNVGKAIATDDLGSIYVTGRNHKDHLSTQFTIKYNATNGKELWLVQSEGP